MDKNEALHDEEEEGIDLFELVAAVYRQRKFIIIGTIILIVLFAVYKVIPKELQCEVVVTVNTEDPPSGVAGQIFTGGQSMTSLFEQQMKRLDFIVPAHRQYPFKNILPDDKFYNSRFDEMLENEKLEIKRSGLNDNVSITIKDIKESDTTNAILFSEKLIHSADSTIKKFILRKVEEVKSSSQQSIDSLKGYYVANEPWSYVNLRTLSVNLDNYLKAGCPLTNGSPTHYVITKKTSVSVLLLLLLLLEFLLVVSAMVVDFFKNNDDIKNKIKSLKESKN